MKLISFIPLSELLNHPYPDARIIARLEEEQFDLSKMVLQGITLDGQRAWFAQCRFGKEKRDATTGTE